MIGAGFEGVFRIPGPLLRVLTVLVRLLQSAPRRAADDTGQGVGASDTLMVLTLKIRQVKVHLAKSDTPEFKQSDKMRAKQALSNSVCG